MIGVWRSAERDSVSENSSSPALSGPAKPPASQVGVSNIDRVAWFKEAKLRGYPSNSASQSPHRLRVRESDPEHRGAAILRRAKATRSGGEIAHGQLVANLRRPGSDIGKAVVAHRGSPFGQPHLQNERRRV